MKAPDLQTMIEDWADAAWNYEQGELSPEQVQEFFQSLLDSGIIFHLQGSYQRTAQWLIDAGVITYNKVKNHE